MMMMMMMLTMSAQPNLLCFSIEGKGTDGQINRATASACSPDLVVWRLPKPAVLQREAQSPHRNTDCECECACVRERTQCLSVAWWQRERRMPRRSPRCRAGHFDFSEDAVSRAHLSAPRWFFFCTYFSVFLLCGLSDPPLWVFFELFRHSLLFISRSVLEVLHF